jgi:predicted PurR-regulated permease PerM
MAEPRQMTVDVASSKRTIDTAIRIGLLALVVYWYLYIFKPFLIPVLWAIIIAVTIHPLYVKFKSLLGGKQKLALSLFTIIALAILIILSILLWPVLWWTPYSTSPRGWQKELCKFPRRRIA